MTDFYDRDQWISVDLFDVLMVTLNVILLQILNVNTALISVNGYLLWKGAHV